MKILIVGSRNIKDIDLGQYILERTDLIISGGVSGVDSLAEKYADAHGISKLILRLNMIDTEKRHRLKGMRKWWI